MSIQHVIRFFFSLRTTLWLLVVILVLFLAGAFIMPGRKEFQLIHAVPMFQWLMKQPLSITWWLWCLIIVISILSINTLLCSVESIVRKGRVTKWLLLISPQIIHIGSLFILLAHLLSAVGGFQRLTAAHEGTYLKMSEGNFIHVKNIDIRTNSSGYITDWTVRVEFIDRGKIIREDIMKPNRPSLHQGLNINVKNLWGFPRKAALLQVNREPGAFWALIGGVLVMVGTAILIILKIKIEK
ncbi:MAG: hypothetical protein JSV71_00590 [Nitrospiraceae bacterium]|nr:MAG: hypothetical protein JSV71_00590 [Nitrospiraceae bacterium]